MLIFRVQHRPKKQNKNPRYILQCIWENLSHITMTEKKKLNLILDEIRFFCLEHTFYVLTLRTNKYISPKLFFFNVL